jgi:hypothetical protein
MLDQHFAICKESTEGVTEDKIQYSFAQKKGFENVKLLKKRRNRHMKKSTLTFVIT